MNNSLLSNILYKYNTTQFETLKTFYMLHSLEKIINVAQIAIHIMFYQSYSVL